MVIPDTTTSTSHPLILIISHIIIFQTKEFTFRGHGGSVDQLCWHASNPNLLSTASGDKSVRIWDASSQKCAATIVTKGMHFVKNKLPQAPTCFYVCFVLSY